jgi:hypothetical protein
VGLVGVVLWLWNWASLQNRRVADPEGEARSAARRAYLLIIVAVALLGSLGSLAFVLYRLFNAILGVDGFTNVASSLSAALGVLLVAAALAAYHGLAERRDHALRERSAPGEAQPSTATPPLAVEPAGPGAERALVLRGPSPEALDTALTGLRAALPPEIELEER